MTRIGRASAAILLAGAVAGAAAFAQLLAGGSVTGRLGLGPLPPAPTSPLIVEAAGLPQPAARVPAAPLSVLRQAGVLHAAIERSAAPTSRHARPIAIAPVTAPSAKVDAPLPAPPTQAVAAPAPQPSIQPVVTPPVAPAPADRVLAASTPALAAPLQKTDAKHDHGHDHGGHDHGNDGNHDDQKQTATGPAVLAAVPLDPAPPIAGETPPVDAAPVDGTENGHRGHDHSGDEGGGGDNGDGG